MNPRESEGTVVPVAGLTEMLSVIPYMVGFHPSESMVVVCLHGERQRSGLVLRIDLPAPGDEARWIDELVARAEHQDADGVLLVCYSDHIEAGGAKPWQTLVDGLRAALERQAIRVAEAALVRTGRWWSFMCRDPACCPPEGLELPDAPRGAAARFGAETALSGRRVFGSRAELEATVSGPSADRLAEVRRLFAAAAHALYAEYEAGGRLTAQARTVELAEAAWAAYAAGERSLCAEDAARICLGLEDPAARDHVASLPVTERGPWLALLGDLARLAPDDFAAPICTVLAWVAYQHGEGALANVAVDRALTCRPGYSMAAMLRDSLNRQISPELIREVSRAVRARRDIA